MAVCSQIQVLQLVAPTRDISGIKNWRPILWKTPSHREHCWLWLLCLLCLFLLLSMSVFLLLFFLLIVLLVDWSSCWLIFYLIDLLVDWSSCWLFSLLIDLLVALLLVAAIVVALVVVVDDVDDVDVATEFLTQEDLTSHVSHFNEKSASNQAPTKCRLQNQVDQWMYGRVHIHVWMIICSGPLFGPWSSKLVAVKFHTSRWH